MKADRCTEYKRGLKKVSSSNVDDIGIHCTKITEDCDKITSWTATGLWIEFNGVF